MTYNVDEVIPLVNYKELYLDMMRATEKAIRILIEAQQSCEEAFLQDSESPQLYILPKQEEHEENP